MPEKKIVSGGGKLHLVIRAPYHTYYDGPADSLSAVNQTGPFDILPYHHNFISLLVAGELGWVDGPDRRSLNIERGLLHCANNQVSIFLEL